MKIPAPFIFGLGMLAGMFALPLSACLQGFGLSRGTTPDGKPSFELCAELARAQPSASAVNVASAPPSSAPSGAPSAGVLQHAR